MAVNHTVSERHYYTMKVQRVASSKEGSLLISDHVDVTAEKDDFDARTVTC